MYILRLIIISLFLVQTGKSCSLHQYDYCKIAIGKDVRLEKAKFFSSQGSDELPLLRRKYKAKGIQIAGAAITHQVVDFFDPGTELIFRFHEVCFIPSSTIVTALRGPPSLLS